MSAPLPAPIQTALNAIFSGDSQYASEEALATAATLANIARKASDRELTPEQAATAIEMQRQATLDVLVTVTGIRDIDARILRDQAIDVLKALVVKAAGPIL